MRASVLLSAVVGLVFVVESAPAAEPVQGKPIDVVICLDTSTSMEGLIGSAKHKLWDIVNQRAKGKPAPHLRVAVFSYGNNSYDAKAGWVRKEIDLATDLDKVSEKLFALGIASRANSSEYVGRVARDALETLKWSDGAGALKVVFVCGNEAADQDPEVKLKPLAETAARKGIIINTIYCGRPTDALAAGWKEFADLAEGRFAAIDQDRGTVAVATPHDKELAELGVKLNATYCFAGKDAKLLAENQRRQDDNAYRLSLPAAAARAESKAGGLYRFDGIDLVERLKTDPKFDVKKIAVEELPDDLKKLTPEQREKHVRDLLARRETLQQQINELAGKRENYVREELKKSPSSADRAFDEAVKATLREQAQKKGIDLPK